VGGGRRRRRSPLRTARRWQGLHSSDLTIGRAGDGGRGDTQTGIAKQDRLGTSNKVESPLTHVRADLARFSTTIGQAISHSIDEHSPRGYRGRETSELGIVIRHVRRDMMEIKRPCPGVQQSKQLVPQIRMLQFKATVLAFSQRSNMIDVITPDKQIGGRVDGPNAFDNRQKLGPRHRLLRTVDHIGAS